ncbi:MAG: DUF5916 domain-containing protein [Gemmatimonadota bacterium]|jgi:hypothetical protein
MLRSFSLPHPTLVAALLLAPTALHAQGASQAPAGAHDLRELPRPTLHAVPTPEPIRLDGELDDAVWSHNPPAGDFVQAEPHEGDPASEDTEVWVAYDDDNLYVAAHLRDSDPTGPVVNDIRKDFDDQTQDVFSVILDTFADHRNGYVFMTNPEGARGDRQVANEGREINTSWDAIWSVETQRTEDGWTLEMAIPFRTLRFDAQGDGHWGLNFARTIRRKNETDYWAPVPRAYNLMRLSLAGDLQGLPTQATGRDLRVKPFGLAGTVRETGGDAFERKLEVGLDVKYGLTRGLTLDLTANPDFAQVEADEQKVNLTQFSLFFEEKREFFLENSGVFYVGDAARNNRVRLTPTPDEDLLLFFSRRIGLDDRGQAVPIRGGVRLTGQVAGLEVGGIAMRTGDLDQSPGSDYAVLRLRRNVLSASDVGAIFMMRRGVDLTDDYNRVFGIDANIRFPGEVDWSSYLIRTEAPEISSGNYAFRTSLNREGNFLHTKVGVMQLGDGFRDDLGYYRRIGVRKWLTDAGLRPRPQWWRDLGGREIHPHITWNYFEDLDGRMVAKKLHSGLSFFMESGAWVEASANPVFERIEEPFTIDRRVDPVPPGGYHWNEWMIRGSSDQSRRVSLSVTGIVGGLWSGTQRTIQATLTGKPSYRLEASLGVQRTTAELDLPEVEFVKTFWTGKGSYSFTRNMFVDALVQYDPATEQFNSNVRFNFIHHPLSDLYVVWNEQRFFTGEELAPGRSLTVKVTQMVAF